MSYQILIDSEDRTDCVITKSLVITDEARDKPSIARFNFFDKDELGDLELDEEILITKGETTLFAGKILEAEIQKLGAGETLLKVVCIDYTRILDRNMVVEAYEGMTDKEIIEDIVSVYCQGTGITINNVIEGVTINKIVFNYMQPSQCFRKICELTGRSWYLDYDKDIHYFPLTTTSAPWDIDSAEKRYSKLKIKKDNSDIRNRVYVRGGAYLSDPTTIEVVADGEQTVFNLPEKPHDFSMKEGGVAQTVGIKNIDDPASFDYLLNFQEKYVEVGSGSAPAADTVMEFTFKYDIPVLVAVQDEESVDEVGPFEHAIFDNKIKDLDTARERAQAEIADYGDTIIDGSFKTIEDGFRAGQYININLSEYGVNDDYLIQKVVARSLGGGEFIYEISIANTKKLGIINYLIKLLENDKNFLDIDPDEVVDELFTPAGQEVIISDTIISDDFFTPPYKWGTDADEGKWNLAQWS